MFQEVNISKSLPVSKYVLLINMDLIVIDLLVIQECSDKCRLPRDNMSSLHDLDFDLRPVGSYGLYKN